MHNEKQNNSSSLRQGLGCRAKTLALVLSAMSLAAVAQAAPKAPWPVTLREQATRLADAGFRIGRTAAPLCPATAAGSGIAIDYIEAYNAADRPAVARLLGLTRAPQVAAVASGGPAAGADVRSGDEILAINGVTAESLRTRSPSPALFADELEQRIADLPSSVPVVLALRRSGKRIAVSFVPVPVCAVRFVIKADPAVAAYTDGHNVAVTSGLIGFTRNDDELALVLGHETGHIIHGDGDHAGAGRTERRLMEDRADATGLQLTGCAGYDLETALQYRLRRAASRPLEGLFQGDHRPSRARATRMRKLAPLVTCPPDAQ